MPSRGLATTRRDRARHLAAHASHARSVVRPALPASRCQRRFAGPCALTRLTPVRGARPRRAAPGRRVGGAGAHRRSDLHGAVDGSSEVAQASPRPSARACRAPATSKCSASATSCSCSRSSSRSRYSAATTAPVSLRSAARSASDAADRERVAARQEAAGVGAARRRAARAGAQACAGRARVDRGSAGRRGGARPVVRDVLVPRPGGSRCWSGSAVMRASSASAANSGRRRTSASRSGPAATSPPAGSRVPRERLGALRVGGGDLGEGELPRPGQGSGVGFGATLGTSGWRGPSSACARGRRRVESGAVVLRGRAPLADALLVARF